MTKTDVRIKLEALAAFAPELRDPRASAGAWTAPASAGTPDDPLTMPAFNYSDLIKRFVTMAYHADWVADFDWPQWSRTEEGRSLLQDPSPLFNATVDQMAKVITAIIRADRFSEGALAEKFESGHLRTLAERAEALLQE